ncbi:MAG: hypothetical protein HY821_10945 [Acidobacteria bacterium]|nr:hypothetical protein [Acidobacteriota bacterium]
MRHPAVTSLSILLALSLIAGAWMLHTRQQFRAECEAQIDGVKKQLAAETAKGLALEGDLNTLRAQLSEKGIEPAVAPRAVHPENDSKRLEAVRELTQAQSKLSAATASVSELRNHISDLESSVERLTAENKRLQAAEANVKEDLENTQNVAHALEAEVKAKNERIAQMEPTLRKAREELAAVQQKSSQAQPVAAELADLNRRRENIVTSLQRRYRDVTDQLRALTVRLDTQRDNPAAAVGDISRLQTAVQSAEDELRQLGSLNAQAQRLAQKLNQAQQK